MIDKAPYKKQVALLMRVLPIVAQESCFALKGGTAINLFIRDMPRLSVDIDLTYLPIRPRDESLREIDASLKNIADKIEKSIPDTKIRASLLQGTAWAVKLVVSTKEAWCNPHRECPDGHPSVPIRMNTYWGMDHGFPGSVTLYICRGDSIITPSTTSYDKLAEGA